jgi:hypothetical protein
MSFLGLRHYPHTAAAMVSAGDIGLMPEVGSKGV